MDAPPEAPLQGLTSDHQHGFLNVSVTPIECSVVCHESWATNVFGPAIAALPPGRAADVVVFADTYTVLAVISAGHDAASRVMDLSSPLAIAGVPIFFITTYYSDFILVPDKGRAKVVEALSAKGFDLAENQSSFVNRAAYPYPYPSYPFSPGPPRAPPAEPSPHAAEPPDTSPAAAAALQARVFDLMQARRVVPYVDKGLQLVQCSGREASQLADAYGHRLSLSRQHAHPPPRRDSWMDKVDTRLYTCLVSALTSRPRFLSLTLAQDDPPSLLLDRRLLSLFGDSVVGDTDANLVPIFLDLRSLPSEVTGIVCGVAGRLVDEMDPADTCELSYLSTARAGAVVLTEEQSVRALEVLRPLMREAGEGS